MTFHRDLGRDAVVILGSRVVGVALGLVVTVLLFDHLGATGFGVFAVVTALGVMGNIIVNFGTDVMMVRLVASGDERAIAPIAGFQLAMAISVAVSTVFVSFGLEVTGAISTDSAVAVSVMGLGLVPLVWATVAGSVLRGQKRFVPVAVASLAASTATAIGVVVVVATDRGVVAAVTAVLAGQITNSVVSVVAVQREVVLPKPTWSWSSVREAIPFGVMVVASTVAAQSGQVAIGTAGPAVAAAGYGAAWRVSESLRLIPASLYSAWFPRMVDDEVDAGDPTKRPLTTVVGASALLAGLVIAVADPLVDLMFDGADDVTGAVRWLAVGLVPVTVRLHRSSELIAAGRERVVGAVAAVSAVLTIGGVGVAAAATNSATWVAAVHTAGIALHAVLLWFVPATKRR